MDESSLKSMVTVSLEFQIEHCSSYGRVYNGDTLQWALTQFQTSNEMDKLLKNSKIVEMTLVHPNAAGIDIGDSVHAVAVPAGRDVESVRTFGAFTCDLEAIVEWLTKCGI